MGQEIGATHFSGKDFAAFSVRLRQETALLSEWFRARNFSTRDRMGGYELEAWLVDAEFRPAPVNEVFLQRLDNPMVVPELARFNFEINDHPQYLHGSAFSRCEASLGTTWQRCTQLAGDLHARPMMIGILPTVRAEELSLPNMSGLNRYRALYEQVLRLREGAPVHLDITGHQHLKIANQSVMLEAATTSFQLHLKVRPELAARAYNASLILSAPMVAVSANSPFLFGHDLWAETRVPLFEQAVAVGGLAGASHGPLRRATFGSGYVRDSVLDCFQENAAHYPVLLPIPLSEGPEQMAHVRLHNGTIWRWNRPLIGFDDDGMPHLRIEHRVVPAGPTIADMMANAAFFHGLMQALLVQDAAPEQQLPFATARDNFYAAAQHGLDAQVCWSGGQRSSMQALVMQHLLPLARSGLQRLEIDRVDSERYLQIIEQRVQSRQTGAAWQRAAAARCNHDLAAMTAVYYRRQQGGRPVHEWEPC
jgi:gamma-glutamyl:cysteine ligase YbdK (ATP-grasp superfamily)